jgi:flagellar hook-basal body complex protein FliE
MIPSVLPSSLSSTFATSRPGGGVPAPGQGGGGFAQELQGAMHQMEQLDTGASHQVNAMIAGQSVDLHSSLIAVEKADLAFGMMLQLRNKAVSAYQQLANMQF